MKSAIDLIAQDVFDKIRGRFSNLEMGSESGNVTMDPADARFFDFDFAISGNNLGRVSISINELGALKLFYGSGILDGHNPLTHKIWFDFLREMRNFAKRRLLRFDTRDIAKSNLDKTDFKYLASVGTKEENMAESRMFGSKKSSYYPLEKTKLIIRHSKSVDEEQQGSRSRNISSIYIENADGERFKYPYIHLGGAKAMQRHVANGGRPYDSAGNAIIKMSEQIAQLTAFKRHVGRHDSMQSEANTVMDQASAKLNSLKHQVTKLSNQRYYQDWQKTPMTAADSQAVMDQATLESYKSKFTINTFSEDLEQFFPLLHSIMQEKNELDLETYVGETTKPAIEPANKVNDFSAFESWADAIVEGRLAPDTVTSLKDLIDNKLSLGVDGINAIESLEGIGITDDELESALVELAKLNSEADPVPTIAAWLETFDPDAAEQLNLTTATDEDMSDLIASDSKIDVREIAEMVKSFYDEETGNFPIGETGVVIKITKALGDHAGSLAEQLVQHLAARQETIEYDVDQHGHMQEPITTDLDESDEFIDIMKLAGLSK